MDQASSNNESFVVRYDSDRASNYDEESRVDKGNREVHKQFLSDVLRFLKVHPKIFLDLGCGTGFFSEVFFKVFPGIKGILVDGSKEMLKMANERFLEEDFDKDMLHALLENIDWSAFADDIDIIFSALAIHHLEDEEKWNLFRKIYDKLSDSGVFIIYDLFHVKDQRSQDLLEFLACMDQKKRLMEEIDVDIEIEEFKIENIIKSDRRIRKLEGDKEACHEEQINRLIKCGFKSVTPFLQENRFFGVIAFKK